MTEGPRVYSASCSTCRLGVTTGNLGAWLLAHPTGASSLEDLRIGWLDPVPARAEKALQLATPEEGAAWLAAHPADALRLERAQEKRARRAAARAARAGSSPA